MSNVKQLVRTGVTPDKVETTMLKREASQVIGGLSYFLLTDFDVPGVIEAYATGKTPDVDEILNNYVAAVSTNLEEFCVWIHTVQKNFQLTFEVFEDYPELEEEFMQVTGPAYYTIPDGVLTLDSVKEIIDGKITVDEFIASISSDDLYDNVEVEG